MIVVFSGHKYSIFTLKSFRRQIYSGYENIVPVSYAERSITAFTCTDRKIVVARHAVKTKDVRDLFECRSNQVSDYSQGCYKVVSILL